MDRSTAGKWGWALLGGFVLIWDLFAPETLSDAFGRAMDHKTGRVVVSVALALTSAHLLDLLPEPVDPYHHLWRAGNVVKRGMRAT